jgi:hypothetical protein
MGFTPKQTAEGDRPHAIRDLETETEPGTINYPSSADVEHMEKDTETFLLSARVGEEVNEDLHWSEDPLDSTKAPAEETLEHTNGDEPTHNAMPVAADGESITSNPDQVGLESDPTQSDNHMHEEDSSAGSWNWLPTLPDVLPGHSHNHNPWATILQPVMAAALANSRPPQSPSRPRPSQSTSAKSRPLFRYNPG